MNAPVMPTRPRPRIAIPVVIADPLPSPSAAEEALAADIGELPAELKPLHGSPVALRVDLPAVAVEAAPDLVGAAELENTDWPP